MQQNKTQTNSGATNKKHFSSRLQPHRCRPHSIRHYIQQRKHPTDYTETQTAHIRQNMLILNQMRAVIRDLLQTILRLPQNPINEVPEALLKKHRKHQPKGQVPTQRHHDKPPQR